MNPVFEVRLVGTELPHVYRAEVPDPQGKIVAANTFELRSDSVELTMTLGALAHAAESGGKPEKDLHIGFGKRIFSLLFSGAVADLWRSRRKAAGRDPLALALRIDPKGARFLLRIPWEYLHDEKGFLAVDWRTPVYRLPWETGQPDFLPLTEPLRMLVVIAAPLGLNENQVLNFPREEDLILVATAEARKTGRLRLEFSPNGSLEALEEQLRAVRPHLLHFVGHGVFVDAADSGLLLMENRDGRQRQVWNADFAKALEQYGRDLPRRVPLGLPIGQNRPGGGVHRPGAAPAGERHPGGGGHAVQRAQCFGDAVRFHLL